MKTIDLRDTSAGSVYDYLACLPNDPDEAGIGFMQLVGHGRDVSQLEDGALDLFLKLCVLQLMEHGRIPVCFAMDADGTGHYEVETKYGYDPVAIAEGMVRDWRATGGGLPEWGVFWLGRLVDLVDPKYWPADMPPSWNAGPHVPLDDDWTPPPPETFDALVLRLQRHVDTPGGT